MPIARPGVLEAPPYVPGEQGLAGRDRVIALASNECVAEPSPRAVAACRAAATELRRYPATGSPALRLALARRFELDHRRIVCGNGSEELIHLAARAYAGPGDEVVVSRYGYALFAIAAQLAGAAVVTAPDRDLVPDVDALLAATGPRTRLVFLANPNNPTGAVLPSAEIERLQRGLPEECLLVIDAAYAEFADGGGHALTLAHGAPNVLVLRTFSKAYGLAGMRVGWGYAAAPVIDVLNRVRAPSNLSHPAEVTAAAALGDAAHVAAAVRRTVATREAFAAALRERGLKVPPSGGNFVLAEFPSLPGRSAADADAFLRSRGILLRRLEPYRLDHALRITIGSEAEMAAVADAIAEFLAR